MGMGAQTPVCRCRLSGTLRTTTFLLPDSTAAILSYSVYSMAEAVEEAGTTEAVAVAEVGQTCDDVFHPFLLTHLYTSQQPGAGGRSSPPLPISIWSDILQMLGVTELFSNAVTTQDIYGVPIDDGEFIINDSRGTRVSPVLRVRQNAVEQTTRRPSLFELQDEAVLSWQEIQNWEDELEEGDKVQLKTLLASKFAEHTIASKPGESCYDYLLRHCQRFPKKDRGDLLKSGFGVKKLSTLKSEKRQLDDEKKWAVQPQSKKNRGKKGKKTKGINESVEPQPHNFELGSSLEDLGVSIDVDVGDDLDIEDLWGVLNLLDSDMFDMKDVATLKLANRDARVSLNGELGDWIKIEVKGSSVSEGADSDGTMSVRCDCNRCNFDGSCQFVTTFNAIQFGKVPRCLGAEDAFSWTAQVARAGRIANRLNIDVCTPASK